MQITANRLTLEVEDHGPKSGEPLLLVMGLGMQLTGWPDEFVQLLVAKGFRVIRFDNRDIGLSQGFDHLGAPNLIVASLRYALRLPVSSPYTLDDMARDAVGVLDALGIARAHVCGASMGGMIAQLMAIHHPERLKSLTLMMTTSGSRRLPQPSARVRQALLARPANRSEAAIVDNLIRLIGVIGSPGYPPDAQRLRERVLASVRRSERPAGMARQLTAVVANGDRTGLLARIKAPSHVIHGLADPLVPVAAGHDLKSRISGASGDFIDGMGHDLPTALLPRFADGIAGVAARV